MSDSPAGTTNPAIPDESDRQPAPLALSPERRRFLTWLTGGLGGLAMILASVPVLGVVFGPLRRTSPQVWRAVARADDVGIGQTLKVTFFDPAPVPWAGFAAQSAAWLRREDDGSFVAFSIYCTHTGCPVRWDNGARLFLCPCHGGTFYSDGSIAGGPPPVPLDRHPVRLRDGNVELRTIGVPVPAEEARGAGRRLRRT